MIPERFLRLRSIPLRQVVQGVPGYNGVGCMAVIKNKKYFLTVYHLLRNRDSLNNRIQWGIEVEYSPDRKETLQYPLKDTQRKSPIRTGSSKFDYFDFAIKVLPDDFNPMWSHFDIPNEKFKYSEGRLPVTLQYDLPSEGDEFGFAGHSGYQDVNNALMANNYVFEGDMRFVEKKGHFYVFALANKHKGHKYYEGCSGAPIINKAGEVYALVTGGNIRKNQIYGISLASVKELIESTVVV